jgi:hypothetical protein
MSLRVAKGSVAVLYICHCEWPKGAWQSYISVIASEAWQSHEKKGIYFYAIASLCPQ